MIFTLTKPITAHGEEKLELDLRDPTAKDVMEIGFPYLVVQGNDGEGVELRPKIVGKYVVRLAGIPPSSVEQLSIADLQSLQAIVMGFFGQDAAAAGA